ncbi:hypothetical protein OG21DRAFT_1369218, partial [Imleria badia]
NTVQLFNSLAAMPSMNWILLGVVDMVLEADIDFRVFHIPGSHNVVADHLSRLWNDLALKVEPDLRIYAFQPPQVTLGAAQ